MTSANSVAGRVPPVPADVSRRIEAQRGQRYLIVACDSHAGPSLEHQLRQYCPAKYLEDFDKFTASYRATERMVNRPANAEQRELSDGGAEAMERCRTCEGQQDPVARRRHMDEDGVAVDVIFGGGANGECLPFLGTGFDSGSAGTSAELRVLGGHLWNQWLADYISGAPHRHVGTIQIPVWDVPATIKEIEWAASVGLGAINFPSPQAHYPAYNDPVYEPLWSVVEDSGLPLLTHSASAGGVLGMESPGGLSIYRSEMHFFSRRALWQMIFGGVFDRHPKLKIVFTEQRVRWVPDILREMDSIALDDRYNGASLPRRMPSEYWFDHCYLSGSFLVPFEASLREEVGLRNVMWGSDYPHPEGTWPHTALALRYTFGDVPEDHTRMILGDNAADVYNLDREKLAPVVEQIGPTPAEVARPVVDSELPSHRGLSFRTLGSYS